MSDHLPECPATEVSMSGHSTPPPDYELTYTACICDRLRACEARVEQRIDAMLAKANDYGERTGYAAGLSAARDAVEAMRDENRQGTDPEWGVLNAALASIDALRGESNG